LLVLGVSAPPTLAGKSRSLHLNWGKERCLTRVGSSFIYTKTELIKNRVIEIERETDTEWRIKHTHREKEKQLD
jgi:hypothetical protein